MAIKGLKSLKQLDLSFNVFGDLGALCLSLAFRSHPRLRYLSVGHCEITNTGAAALGGLLYSCPLLHLLSLKNNHITDEGVSLLGSWLVAKGKPPFALVRDCVCV